MLAKARVREAKILRLALRPKMYAGEKLGWLQAEDSSSSAHQVEENGSVDDGRKHSEQNVDDCELGYP